MGTTMLSCHLSKQHCNLFCASHWLLYYFVVSTKLKIKLKINSLEMSVPRLYTFNSVYNIDFFFVFLLYRKRNMLLHFIYEKVWFLFEVELWHTFHETEKLSIKEI